jgi:hypothetical protein
MTNWVERSQVAWGETCAEDVTEEPLTPVRAALLRAGPMGGATAKFCCCSGVNRDTKSD